MIQPLEHRVLCAEIATAVLRADGLLDIFGTPGPEHIFVRRKDDRIIVATTGQDIEESEPDAILKRLINVRASKVTAFDVFLKGDDDQFVIFGNIGKNARVQCGRGQDTVITNAGSDSIFGQIGDDYLHGRNGRDTVHGGGGDDACNGEGGADWIIGDLGTDIMTGGTGDDRFVSRDGNDADAVIGGPGFDRAEVDPPIDVDWVESLPPGLHEIEKLVDFD